MIMVYYDEIEEQWKEVAMGQRERVITQIEDNLVGEKEYNEKCAEVERVRDDRNGLLRERNELVNEVYPLRADVARLADLVHDQNGDPWKQRAESAEKEWDKKEKERNDLYLELQLWKGGGAVSQIADRDKEITRLRTELTVLAARASDHLGVGWRVRTEQARKEHKKAVEDYEIGFRTLNKKIAKLEHQAKYGPQVAPFEVDTVDVYRTYREYGSTDLVTAHDRWTAEQWKEMRSHVGKCFALEKELKEAKEKAEKLKAHIRSFEDHLVSVEVGRMDGYASRRFGYVDAGRPTSSYEFTGAEWAHMNEAPRDLERVTKELETLKLQVQDTDGTAWSLKVLFLNKELKDAKEKIADLETWNADEARKTGADLSRMSIRYADLQTERDELKETLKISDAARASLHELAYSDNTTLWKVRWERVTHDRDACLKSKTELRERLNGIDEANDAVQRERNELEVKCRRLQSTIDKLQIDLGKAHEGGALFSLKQQLLTQSELHDKNLRECQLECNKSVEDEQRRVSQLKDALNERLGHIEKTDKRLAELEDGPLVRELAELRGCYNSVRDQRDEALQELADEHEADDWKKVKGATRLHDARARIRVLVGETEAAKSELKTTLQLYYATRDGEQQLKEQLEVKCDELQEKKTRMDNTARELRELKNTLVGEFERRDGWLRTACIDRDKWSKMYEELCPRFDSLRRELSRSKRELEKCATQGIFVSSQKADLKLQLETMVPVQEALVAELARKAPPILAAYQWMQRYRDTFRAFGNAETVFQNLKAVVPEDKR